MAENADPSGESVEARYHRIQSRQQHIALILQQVERNGFCEFTGNPLGWLDDAPEHPLMEALRIIEEGNAAREGRRPHLESPRTFLGDIQIECARRDWKLQPDYQHGTYSVFAPLKQWQCPSCGGSGKLLCLPPFSDHVAESLTVQVVAFEACTQCAGRGHIESRVAPVAA